VFPRALYSSAREREELTSAGVYILEGPSEDSSLPRIYVGEGDPIRSRLEQHVRQKEFWTRASVFSSKDRNLNKAHIQYLEARLLRLAADAKRCELDNTVTPVLPNLSEADTADAEGFLEDVLLCLPILGIGVFEKPVAPAVTNTTLFITAKGISARGFESPQGFVVKVGSGVVQEEQPSIHAYLHELRQDLFQKSVISSEFAFNQDYVFSSPSTAAGVVLGRSSNGRTEWKDSQGRTLKTIQESELEVME
jgi:hypothetical protein